MTKLFVPCLYLYRGMAVKSPSDKTPAAPDPVELARSYGENNTHELLVYDLADTEAASDQEREETLDLIKKICGATQARVIAAGGIRRAEDVKKLIYAGCGGVLLDYTRQSHIELTKEVSQRFGREKILASCREAKELWACREKLERFVSAVLLTDPHQLQDSLEASPVPLYVQLPQISLNHLMELLSCDKVRGITGNIVNENFQEIPALQKLGLENGILINALETACPWSAFQKNEAGLVPVVVQDDRTQEVLMVAYMNQEAYQNTLLTGKMNYYSRSRGQQWLKGETSGHYQYVRSLTGDCDMDTILAKVYQVGAACHTGAKSCFFHEIVRREGPESSNPLKVFEDVFQVIQDRKLHPKEGSYTNYLFDKGLDKILKKLGEEATEIVIAAKNPNPNEVKYEISDFLYHMMVLMAERGISWEEITDELANR